MEVCPSEEQAGDVIACAMKQVLGIKDEAARMKVTPPLAVAPLAHGDDMRWKMEDGRMEPKRRTTTASISTPKLKLL